MDITSEFDKINYVAASIESGITKVFTEPTLVESAVPINNRQLEKMWEKHYEIHLEKINEFEDLWVKAYALIWERFCSREVQYALKEMSDFNTVVKNEPLELLARVERLIHTHMKAKYPPLTLLEVLYSFLNLKQGENEVLLDYLGRFKSERNVMLNLFGKKMLDGFAENTPKYLALPFGASVGQANVKKKLFIIS